MKRFWLIEDRLCTSQELRTAGISPLRCVDLGRWQSAEQARASFGCVSKKQAEWGVGQAAAMAHNVRIACDSGRGARWGLSGAQIERLRAGEIIQLEDSLGRFQIGYSTLEESEG